MKTIKIILTLIFSISFLAANAQGDGNGNLVKEQLPYIGVWKWESHDSVFTIKIEKVQIDWKKFEPNMPDNAGVDDILIGWHELVVKGKIVESNLNVKNNSFKYEKQDHMIFWNTMPKNEKEIQFSNFKNLSKGKSAKGVFIIQSDDNNKAEFILYESILQYENVKVGVKKVKDNSTLGSEKSVLYTINPGTKIEKGFTVPNRIILTRIK